MSFKDFKTKARLLVDDDDYVAAVKNDILRDTQILGLRSNKVCKNALTLGNTLIFNHIYNLTKIN